MSNLARHQFWPYTVAVVNVGLALTLMLGLDQWLGVKTSPFLLFFGAIVLSAGLGGLKSGLLATGLSAILSQYFFMYPFQQWETTLSDVIRTSIFVIEGIGLSLFCGAWKTEKKRAEANLQQLKLSEQRWNLAFSSSNITVFQQDQSLRYQWINNPAGLNLPKTVVGQSDYHFWKTEIADQLTAIKRRVLRTGIPAREEVSLVYNGKLNYYDLIIEPIRESVGEIIGITGVAINITERKAMEEAIRESEQRFRATFNQAAVGIAQVDLDGQFIEVNPALCKITGYSHQELSRMNFQEITHADDLAQDWELARQVLAREISGYSLEKRYLRKDNSMTWVNLTSSVVWDELTGKPKYAVGIIEDISERKKVETSQQFLVEASQILASSLDYEATLIQLAYLAVPLLADWCIVDLLKEDGIIQDLAIVCHHPEKQALLCEMRQKYPPNLAHPNSWLQQIRLGKSWFYPQVPQSLLEEIAQDSQHLQLLQRLKGDSLIIVPLRCRDKIFGSLFFAMSESNRYYEPSDLALAEDVARRAAATIDNARLYQETERANRIKDEFLAILSHELRTPLNPILGWAKLLRTRNYDEETRQKALEIIERNTKLQVQLVEDLLDVSRILQGKLHLTITPVNLVTIIESSMETVRLAAQGKLIDLKFIIQENPDIDLNPHPIFQHLNLSETLQNQLISPPFLVLGDSGRLQQIMWNLLSNAVKFTPPKGNITIELSVVQTPDVYAQIQVIDSGKGITSDFLPYIFDYFRQADGAINRQYGGLGLGLAIVRHLVELHGGIIVAQSRGENQGSTFTVKLPLINLPQKQEFSPKLDFLQNDENHNQGLLVNSVLQGTRILIVDDEADTRDLVAFILEQQGATVKMATSALKALQILSQFQPDVCISDIGMPTIDGYMLIRKIRSLPADQGGEIPAIALTAYATEGDQQKSLSAGFQRHLPKPIEPNDLITAISELLQEPQNSD